MMSGQVDLELLSAWINSNSPIIINKYKDQNKQDISKS